jgi:pimeloyl-ACP methyl ester carboxylesterase
MNVMLVLMPGMDGTGVLFGDFVAALPAGIDALVIRYPVSESLDYASLESLVREQLPQRPFVLLAESFSGPIGLSIASNPPSMLRGLVLCATFAKLPFPCTRWMGLPIRIAPAWRLPLPLLDIVLLGRHVNPDLHVKFANAMASVSPSVLKHRALQALRVDVSDKLPEVRIPTLYLRAREDRLIGRSAANHLASGIPSMQIVEFDAPHFLLQTRPAEAANVVATFIQRCGSA